MMDSSGWVRSTGFHPPFHGQPVALRAWVHPVPWISSFNFLYIFSGPRVGAVTKWWSWSEKMKENRNLYLALATRAIYLSPVPRISSFNLLFLVMGTKERESLTRSVRPGHSHVALNLLTGLTLSLFLSCPVKEIVREALATLGCDCCALTVHDWPLTHI